MVQKDNITVYLMWLQVKLISNLLNHLFSFIGLLESKMSSSYARVFWLSYCNANEYYKNKRLILNSIVLALETKMLVQFSLVYATTKV